MNNNLATLSCVLSVVLAGAAGFSLVELKKLDRKVDLLETPADPKPVPDAAMPPADDPRAPLASRIEALERRMDRGDADFAFNLDGFRRELDETDKDIDEQMTEIMAKLAELRANPPQELTDAILEERVRAGLFEKRKKDMRKLVKKEGQKALKKSKEKLNLTEAQVEELKKFFESLYDEWSETLAHLFSGEEIPADQLEAKVDDTRKRTDTKVKEVLTPEQYETFTKEIAPTMFKDPFQR